MNEINTTKKTKSEANSSSWLQRLKEESWEAELLVSTVAIYGTFQLFGSIDWLTNLFIDWLHPNQYDVAYFIVCFGLIAISLLASMFVLHFVLRAYWVGLVGLNSVFPDYSLDDSAYSKIYTQKILAILPKLKDSIQKVDELCSVIFSVAFTFMFMYTYISFVATIFICLFNVLKDYVPIYILMLPLYALGVLAVLHTLITIIANIKKFKNNEKIQTWYFYFVKVGGIITCGPLNKSILQVFMIFGSNFKKKKSMVYLLVSFLFFGFIVSFSKFPTSNIPYLIHHQSYFDKTEVVATYYASENKQNNFLLSPEIESDIYKIDVLKIFIPIYRHEKAMRVATCGEYIKDEEKNRLEQRQDSRSHFLKCYNAYNFVYINGEKVVVDFLKYKHPRTKQFGILGYVSLTNPKKGMNTIEVKKVVDKEENNKHWSIPFYYVAK